MQPVDDFQPVLTGLYFWQGYAPSVKADLCSWAVDVKGGLYFIDPIPLAKNPLAQLVSDVSPAGIILTNGNHERAAAVYQKQFQIPIFAHIKARDEFNLLVDHWIAADSVITPGLTSIHLPGAGKGEIAIYADQGQGVMLMGDALIHIEPYGFDFLPEKYCLDFKQMKASLQKLLQFSFEAMTFAHGLPIISGAHTRLEQLF